MKSKKAEGPSAEEARLSQRAMQRRQHRNRESVARFEQTMFERTSRHLVLFLTFSYRKELRPFITLDDIRRDRDAFLNNIPFNELLRQINGYVWKIEEGGRGGGLHMHMVILYNGRRWGDIHIAEQIREYWEQTITRGNGKCWNSNIGGEKHERAWGKFTGQIDRGDEEEREALRGFLGGYMTKLNQPVKSRDNPHTQLFGVGYGRQW